MAIRSARCSSLYHLLNSASLSAGTSHHTINSPVPFFLVAICALLLAHVTDEFIGRTIAPLADERFLGGQQVPRRARVQPVRVGPALVDPAPRVGPVVVDLAAQ